MTKLLSVISLLLATITSAQASTSNINFIAKNSSIETNICITAAEYGFAKAKLEAKKLGVKSLNVNTLTCNGESVKSFAKSFQISPVQPAKQVVLVPGNDSKDTQLCVQAVSNGVRSIGKAAQQLSCNGKPVSRFVKSTKNS